MARNRQLSAMKPMTTRSNHGLKTTRIAHARAGVIASKKPRDFLVRRPCDATRAQMEGRGEGGGGGRTRGSGEGGMREAGGGDGAGVNQRRAGRSRGARAGDRASRAGRGGDRRRWSNAPGAVVVERLRRRMRRGLGNGVGVRARAERARAPPGRPGRTARASTSFATGSSGYSGHPCRAGRPRPSPPRSTSISTAAIPAPTWTSRVSDFGIRPRDHVPTTPPRGRSPARATRAAVASRHASLAPFPRATTNPSPSGVGLGERGWRPRPAGPSRSQSRSGAPRRSMKERPRETLVPAARVDRPVGGLLTDRC